MEAEAIVVVAGPAGASCAYHLASYGRKVLLLDRGSFSCVTRVAAAMA